MNGVIRSDCDWLISRYADEISRLQGKTVLITGACGLVGGYLADLFCCAGVSVIAIDSCIVGDPRRLRHLLGRPGFEFWEKADITYGYIPHVRPDLIFNCASIASPAEYRKLPAETIKVNVEGTLAMLIAAPVRAVMIHFSTSEIYGDPAAVPTPETYNGNVDLMGERAYYAESKRMAEVLCQLYFRLYKTHVRIVRPSNIYGPGQRLDDGRLIPSLVRSVIRGVPFTIEGSGEATRTHCYIRDALNQILYVAFYGMDGEVYNVDADGPEISTISLAELFRSIAFQVPNCSHLTITQNLLVYSGDAPSRRKLDTSKLRSLTGGDCVMQEMSLADGLRRTLESYVRG